MSDGGLEWKFKAKFEPVRLAYDYKGSEDWLPRPAVSNNVYDRIAEIDIFSDDGCGEQLPMTEETNPYKLLKDLNFLISKYDSSVADSKVLRV